MAVRPDDAACARSGGAGDPVPSGRRGRARPARGARRRPGAGGDDGRACLPARARGWLRSSGRSVGNGRHDPSRASPGPRRIGRWTGRGACHRGEQPARDRRAPRRGGAFARRRPHTGGRPMINRPLYGVRIVVTRPESKSLADELEHLGAEVTIVPLIEIRPAEGRALEDAIDTMASYDWVVLTSVNGVAAVAKGLAGLAGSQVAAVGPVTAAAIQELGVEPAFVAKRASDDIAEGLGDITGKRVLL